MPPIAPDTSLYELGLYMTLFLLGLVVSAIGLGVFTLPAFYVTVFGCQLGLRLLQFTGIRVFNYVGMMFRSITRNLLRTSLTYVAIFVLVFVISGMWTILNFVDSITAEKENNLKAIISDKHQFPSLMRRGLEREIFEIAMSLPPEMRPKDGESDMMTWSFVGGALDPTNRTLKNTLFFFAMEPRKLLTIKDGKPFSMMDGIDELTPAELRALNAAIDEMERNPKAVVIGADKLKMMEKKVGDRFKLYCFNYQG